MPTEFETAMVLIKDITNNDGPQKLAEEISTTFRIVNEIPQFDEIRKCCDPSVVQAVQKVYNAVEVAFVCTRAFHTKVYSLAKFILNQEQNTIRSVKEGNYLAFMDYIEEVLEQSQNCQKDLAALRESIDKDSETAKLIEEQKEVVTKVHDDAQEKGSSEFWKAMSAGAGTGVSGTIAIVGGISHSKVAVGAIAAACKSKVVVGGLAAMATSIGTTIVVLSVCASIGLLIFAVKKYMNSRESAKVVALCEKALKAIEHMKNELAKIEHWLDKINIALKSEIDNNYQSKQETNEKKFKRCSSVILDSLTIFIESGSIGAKRLKEYCEPLTKTEDMNDYIKEMTKMPNATKN